MRSTNLQLLFTLYMSYIRVPPPSCCMMQTFPLPDSKMWFVRFSLDSGLNLMACGNRQGKVYLYNPNKVSDPVIPSEPSGHRGADVKSMIAI